MRFDCRVLFLSDHITPRVRNIVEIHVSTAVLELSCAIALHYDRSNFVSVWSFITFHFQASVISPRWVEWSHMIHVGSWLCLHSYRILEQCNPRPYPTLLLNSHRSSPQYFVSHVAHSQILGYALPRSLSGRPDTSHHPSTNTARPLDSWCGRSTTATP
jgi:hypothetical protein